MSSPLKPGMLAAIPKYTIVAIYSFTQRCSTLTDRKVLLESEVVCRLRAPAALAEDLTLNGKA